MGQKSLVRTRLPERERRCHRENVYARVRTSTPDAGPPIGWGSLFARLCKQRLKRDWAVFKYSCRQSPSASPEFSAT